jgi:spermidine/putrescine transport system permease protein
MNPSGLRLLVWRLYVALFYGFLFAPLIVVGVFAFNDSLFPSPPWKGFTFDWFVGRPFGKTGVLMDPDMLGAVATSIWVALPVAALSVGVGTANAFLLERRRFWGKAFLSVAMLWPLVIPGVILGISILAFASRIANGLEDLLDTDLDFMRPGLPLVILGQASFIVSIATLVVGARLRKFDRSLEEAALDLGASRARVFRTVLMPFLRPALVGAFLIAFLMSFENFNTTLMLVGSDSPLPIYMYGQMREGATPAINAISLILVLATGILAGGAALASNRRR